MLSLNFKTLLALLGAGFLLICGGLGCNPATSVSDYCAHPVKRLNLEAGR